MAASKIVSYKGKSYRLLWVGDTKYGRRAKLGFISGDGEFWVAADLVGEAAPPTAAKPRRGGGDMSGRCWECGAAMPKWLADKGEECGNC